MFHLTESQITAIEYLANFKYLTSSQIVKMGLYRKRGYLTNALKVLVDMKRPLLAKHNFNPINGKLESFYYLTKHGTKFLVEELEYSENQIKVPKGLTPIYLKDYHHRKLTIDFHINLRIWLESNNGDVGFFNYYFDKSGNNRSDNKSNRVIALNKVILDKTNSFIPDVNTMFSVDEKEYLYLFEQHNGKDTKRLFEQLYVHINAIANGSVSKKYNIKKAHRVVVVCEHESVKNSVIQRLQKESGIEQYYSFFIFKTNAELEEDFYHNWTLISGENSNFLLKSK
jgi:hypothetical protein